MIHMYKSRATFWGQLATLFIQNIKRVTFLLTGGLYSCSAESDGVAAIVGVVGGRLWGTDHGHLACLRGESTIT